MERAKRGIISQPPLIAIPMSENDIGCISLKLNILQVYGAAGWFVGIM